VGGWVGVGVGGRVGGWVRACVREGGGQGVLGVLVIIAPNLLWLLKVVRVMKGRKAGGGQQAGPAAASTS
jgi:hypothetical protein